MKPNLKAILWILTLLTVIYVSQQYRIAQRARASAQTQHTAISTTPPTVYKVTQIGGQLMRINETTGETHYWSGEGGGWVKIDETNLVTVISDEERQARKAAIRAWYNAIEPDLKAKVSYETWESLNIETPSWQIRESFDTWKRKQAEEKRLAEQESLKPIIQHWYKQLTPEEQAATPYDQFEAKLLNVQSLSARQKVISLWYDLMDDTYKQKVPFERFEAIEIQQPLASLQAALAKQDPLLRNPTAPRRCPIGGETYRGNRWHGLKECPKHLVRLVLIGSDQ